MRRVKEDFLDTLEQILPLQGKKVLEVGCGEGVRSGEIAMRCSVLVAIEPDDEKLERARQREYSSAIDFRKGTAEKLDFEDMSFDIVMFTLSLHHVPIVAMNTAIDEALRVVRKNGSLVFLEPAEEGSFFEAEILFDACDGDERREKAAAYRAATNHEKIRLIQELYDETVFTFDSIDDFVTVLQPKRNSEMIEDFLLAHHFMLKAERRILVFRKK